ncbi:FAD-dependent oxidoreductase [Variovorax guangxiensis]|uniref:GMC family oxidoreductase n=1 Tax=Variovorax guangxiensis TaxID=1775474 RepID=UPI00285E72A7|nr:FAD-dependent oxidoreductase [Variovorax guangxiensis]MDR6858780.1 choline dehydrogenase [Variovorax guangxiensis]
MEIFDYVIIGAGSAGCPLAARLSESGRHSVLVLEAGPRDSNPWIHVPLGFGKTFSNQSVNWCFSTEPSPGLNGRAVFSPCGKVLGGSSSINGLVYSRGQREDFDSWRQEGNTGWAYDDVLPFFRKSEDQQHGASAFHGADGPLGIDDVNDCHPLSEAFIESAMAAGIARNRDFNGASQEGVGAFQVTARAGRRVSSAIAFLREAERRRNVCVRTKAEVEQLTIENGRVTGVTYARRGASTTVQARRTVVLSAGALNSPAILQRSGIGRREWLQEAGIEMRHELRGVGANLQDHLQARLAIRSRRHTTLNNQVRHPVHLLRMGLQYALFRQGPLASAGGQTGGFVRSRAGLDRPDIMYFVMPFSSADLRKGLDRFPGFTIASCLLRPASRGTVRVRSRNPKEAPLIEPHYLEAESDRSTMLAGLRLARRIAAMDPLRQEIACEERPGPSAGTDEELLGYIRDTASSVYHPVGTCRMGSGPDAVVDARLRLRGLSGLVVADASIMPTIVSSPTNAASIMIGERAAAFLLEEA